MNNDIGVLIHYRKSTDIALEFQKAKDMEITSCQLCIWDETLFTPEVADTVKAALASTDFKVTAKLCLRHVVFFKIVEELFGSRGKLELLCSAFVFFPDFLDFFN